MNTQTPIELPYDDNLTIQVAGPAAAVVSFLNLDIAERGDESGSPIQLATVDAYGQTKPEKPGSDFWNRLDDLRRSLPEETQGRGLDEQPPTSEIWLPEAFDVFWSTALQELEIGTDPVRGFGKQDAAKMSLSNHEAEALIDANSLRVHLTLKSCNPDMRLTIPKKSLAVGRIHLLTFETDRFFQVEVKPVPRENVQAFIGPADPVDITCSTNRQPWNKWEKGKDPGYWRCRLQHQPKRLKHLYGVLLFNRASDASCKYWLQGACLRGETVISSGGTGKPI